MEQIQPNQGDEWKAQCMNSIHSVTSVGKVDVQVGGAFLDNSIEANKQIYLKYNSVYTTLD